MTSGLVITVIALICFVSIRVKSNSITQSPASSKRTSEPKTELNPVTQSTGNNTLELKTSIILEESGESSEYRNSEAKESEQNESNEVCTTSTCARASAMLKSAMDLSVDPCQDFYQYACGRWNSTNPIPEGRTNWDVFSRLQQDHHDNLQTILGKFALGRIGYYIIY